MGVPTESLPQLTSESPGNEYAPETTSDSTIPAIPRRNLTEAFDEMYVNRDQGSTETVTPSLKHMAKEAGDPAKSSTLISPSAVTAFDDATMTQGRDDDNVSRTPAAQSSAEDNKTCSEQVPHFYLHPDLKRDLSQALVNRVSFYGVIHDINKEATTMASNDQASFQQSKSADDDDEINSPLLAAVKGKSGRQCLSMVQKALIDEEQWLLSAIHSRKEGVRSSAACPPTFLQAMGEREYENPLSSLETSRTQLWKPSRSWWEAKSGKNPWIEPKSHNKRWRYLWPLIHYHKFLAKCIKKLKRNGVDVKVSVSPVSVFLREEVCAVSDHLAAVSLFSSEEWMSCLANFTGWTSMDKTTESRLEALVMKLKLRPLNEPGDVDSPLLRSQIHEHFLRAMVAAREQMSVSEAQLPKKVNNVLPSVEEDERTDGAQQPPQSTRGGLRQPPPQQLRPSSGSPQAREPGSNSAPPSSSSSPPFQRKGPMDAAMASMYGYHPGMYWWGNGWAPIRSGDESSISALSGDSYPRQFGEYNGIYPSAPAYYPMPDHHPAPEQPIRHPDPPSHPPFPFYHVQDPYFSEHPAFAPGWYGYPPPPGFGAPNMKYGPCQHPQVNAGDTVASSSPSSPTIGASNETEAGSEEQTQQQHQHDPHTVPTSPYWNHLDYAAVALSGIVSPRSEVTPSTPTRQTPQHEHHRRGDPKNDKATGNQNFVAEARPLFIHHSNYYPYGPYTGEGYVPPSPATQFMMSPQVNPQAAAYYSYSYAGMPYGYPSPTRRTTSRSRSPKSHSPDSSGAGGKGRDALSKPGAKETSKEKSMTPPQVVRKVAADDVQTQATAETEAESTSASG